MESNVPEKQLEPAYDLPAPGSKWPCLLAGGITTAFALFLLPLIFVANGEEPLDMVGVGIGVVLLLILLGLGLTLLLCRHTEPEKVQQAVVIVRERSIVTVLGMIVWLLGFVFMLMGIIVAGTPPFHAEVTAVMVLPGILLFLLGRGCCLLAATGLCSCSRIILFCTSAAWADNRSLYRAR